MSWKDEDVIGPAPSDRNQMVAWTDDDIAPQQPKPQQENTLWQEAKRQGGLGLRQAVSALGSVGALPADAVGKAVNYVAGREVVPNQQRALQQTLTRLGLPTPERGIEKFGQGVAESAPAFALAGPWPQVIGNAAIGATQAQPGQEGSSAAIGAVVGGAPSVVGGAVKAVAPHLLGMTTGAGAEAVRQASKGSPEFLANMRGRVEPAAIVAQARQGVQNIRQGMYDTYAKAKDGWAGDTTQLPFQPIVQAATAAANKFSFQGVPQPGTAEVRQQVESVLQNWMRQGAQNPSFFTVEGLDALKRHLQDIVPDNIANRTGRAYVTEVVNGVKEAITRQAPKYAGAMREYWERSNELDEITRSLSLGDKATVDTALRKLQSLTRNNVNTNYGQRMVSAEALKQAGADVMPAVAGQAMNSWAPRGLQTAAGIGGTMANPAAWPTLPLLSPRAVGEVLHARGRAMNDPTIRATIEALRRAGPSAIRGGNGSGNED